MPRRRDSAAPQNPLAVLMDKVARMENEIVMLKQAGPSGLTADDYETIDEPVPWQTLINHTGAHVAAEPTDPAVYYHPGDISLGGVTPAGFKKFAPVVGAAALLTATKGAFSATNGEQLVWTDVDTTDTSVFGITMSVNPNDRVLLKQPGIYIALASAGVVDNATAGSDWGIGTVAGGGAFPNASLLSSAVAANFIDWELGTASTSIHIILNPGTAGTLNTQINELRGGTISMAFAHLHIIHLPAGSTTMTDIV